MRARRGAVAAVVLGAQLAACAPTAPPAGSAARDPAGDSAVVIREDLSGQVIAVIGLKEQHDPPYLDVPYTNFSCLRSFLDRRTGETAHQLYVAASYDRNHDWSAAHDGAGQTLNFIPISRFKIACDAKNNCSYAEEFAAMLPESELSRYPQGFSVTFTDSAGDAQTITVSARQTAAQLAAMAELEKRAAPPSPAAAR